ncbi:uncharacterized protein LOC144541793 isoform X1 [Centroberyx gerrardi]
MYHIVVFEKTNEVEVVPSNWVNEEECMWPPNKVDVVKATKSKEQPGAGWKPYRVRVIFTSNDYNEARLKLEAVEHTDLGTDGEDSPIKPKQRIIPDTLPSAPKILHPFGPDPQGNDSGKEAVLPKAKPRVHHTPGLHQRSRASPGLHQRSRASPDLHQRSRASPGLHQRSRASPDLHQRSRASPGLHQRSRASPGLHQRSRASPDLHQRSRASPGLHQRSRASPDLHQRSRASPGLHQRSRASPGLHQRSRASPDLHQRSRASPGLYQRSRASPGLHQRKIVSSEPHRLLRRPQTVLNTSLLRNILTNQEMMMDQMKIIFKTVQGLKSVTEEEIGV